jgi:hypothetical protein
MAEQRIVAEVKDYAGFLSALRAWIAENNTTYESVGAIAGLQDGYLAKLIASTPTRSFSRMSLAATLQALGLRLQLVVDSEQLNKVRHRYTERTVQGRKRSNGGVDAPALLSYGAAASAGTWRRKPPAAPMALGGSVTAPPSPSRFRRPSSFRSTSRPSRPSVLLNVRRTAVYGPVCTVVWEGRSREASPLSRFWRSRGSLRRHRPGRVEYPVTGW